jgi:oxygen-independent coproporphyrinogen-3 oxidase
MRVMLSKLAEDVFTDANYKKVGIDHFVRSDNALYHAYTSGDVGRDLMGYSIGERRNFIGFGCSAISFLNGTYYHNALKLDDYTNCISNGTLPLDHGHSHVMTLDDTIRSGIILRDILGYFRVDKKAIGEKYGIAFDDYFSGEMEKLALMERDGLVDLGDPWKIVVTELGNYFCRHVASVFDRYHRKGADRQ